MEDLRSFGYICPKCGKAQVHKRSRFALSAAAAAAVLPRATAGKRSWRRIFCARKRWRFYKK